MCRNHFYRIRVGSHLDQSWPDLFEGLSLANEEGGEAVLCVPAGDQALLHGILARVRDLNLTLISVRQFDAPVDRSDDAEL